MEAAQNPPNAVEDNERWQERTLAQYLQIEFGLISGLFLAWIFGDCSSAQLYAQVAFSLIGLVHCQPLRVGRLIGKASCCSDDRRIQLIDLWVQVLRHGWHRKIGWLILGARIIVAVVLN